MAQVFFEPYERKKMKRNFKKILIPILAVSITFCILFANGITASATEISASYSDASTGIDEAVSEGTTNDESQEDAFGEEQKKEDDLAEENPIEPPQESAGEDEPIENPQESAGEGNPAETPQEKEKENNPIEPSQESAGEKNNTENPAISGGVKSISNIFDELYSKLEDNSDKIFSILAFIGTLVVGIGYKSGLLPLLRDALSRLKASIDLVKEDGDKNNLITKEKFSDINRSIDIINESIEKNTDELTRIKWQFEGYEELCAERESMRLILLNQVDMLYAIFMSSALPQYQKDEIGEKIKSMREELLIYEKSEN